MRSNLIVVSVGIIVVFSLLCNSCKFDSLDELQVTNPCDTASVVSYQADIVPILSANCYSCHDMAHYVTEGENHLLEGYSALRVYVDNGQLSCAINWNCPGVITMPYLAGQLDDSLLTKINTWVCQGAPDN